MERQQQDRADQGLPADVGQNGEEGGPAEPTKRPPDRTGGGNAESQGASGEGSTGGPGEGSRGGPGEGSEGGAGEGSQSTGNPNSAG